MRHITPSDKEMTAIGGRRCGYGSAAALVAAMRRWFDIFGTHRRDLSVGGITRRLRSEQYYRYSLPQS